MRKTSITVVALMLMMVAALVLGCTPEETGVSTVIVTTATPHDITTTTAVCGGDATVSQGLSLDELGVCWCTAVRPPTVEDAHLSATTESGSFVCTIAGLDPGAVYHVRAYAQCGSEYYYGVSKRFSTVEDNNNGGGDDDDGGEGGEDDGGEDDGGEGGEDDGGEDDGEDDGGDDVDSHDYVDLGLPSGTLWATCNVGATTPEEYGDYFAWGETESKTTYDWSTYKYANGTSWENPQLTKYCSNSGYGYNGFTDNLTILQPSDDAATANWGSGWCIPNKAQWEELFQNTAGTNITQNGVSGRLLTASNGNSLFLPAAGYCWDGGLGNVDLYGYFLSSSLDTDHPDRAWLFYFYSGGYAMGSIRRCNGQSVRPVRSAK